MTVNTKNVCVRLTVVALSGFGLSIASVRVANAADPVATEQAGASVTNDADRPDGVDHISDVRIAPVLQAPADWIEEGQAPEPSADAPNIAAPILDSDAMQLSFQAFLRKNNGAALEGPVDLRFRIYVVGGALVEGPILVAAVPLVNGVADTTFPISASSFDGSGRELGVSVNGGPEMTPRLPLVTAPYALRVHRVRSEELDDNIELGAADSVGRLAIWSDAADNRAIELLGGASQISTYGSDGLEQIRLWGASWGELLMYDQDDNNLAVSLGATRFGLPPIIPFQDTGGRLSLYDGTGNLRLVASAPNNGGALSLYNSGGAIALQNSVEADGDGLLSLRDVDGTVTVLVEGAEVAADGAQITLRDAAGIDTVIIDAQEGTGAALRLADETGAQKIIMDAQEGTAGGGALYLYNNAGVNTIEIDAEETDSASAIRLKDSGGTTRITLDPQVTGGGRVITPVLEITGGSDLSEQFDIHGDAKPGMVVSIDPNAEGKLVIAYQAYDRKVAGIISGANGVLPGMLMGQHGSAANGDHPVALTGRVYCFADESNGTIAAGDLLTTSDKPGHCMKVTDHRRAQGAILGKAMGKVNNGMVLVLVSLQ